MGSTKARSRMRRRRLLFEPLEVRQLLDASGLAALISPTWFQSVSGIEGPAHAGAASLGVDAESLSAETAEASNPNHLYDWIIQFDTAAVAGLGSIAETTSLLVGGGIEFQTLYGLGMVGQALVRSYGASLDDVTQWLTANEFVSSFELDAMMQLEATSNDPQLGNLWGMTKIQAPQAWNISTGSQSVVVGVIDTGVDYNHVDLAANIWTNPGEIAGNGIDDDGNGFIDDVHGYDFVNNDGDPMDDHNHGTHVAGTIAGVGNNATGVAGVNWSASIMALKFLDSSGSGYLSDAVRAVNYTTMMRTQYGVNIRVTNNSWGGGGYDSAMQTALLANNSAGILFVAAAGNDAANNDVSPHYPANYTAPNVISVAATDSYDQLASFSCYGATTVDLGAPGVSIYSTITGNRYAYFSGTSMATPHVAGAAALAWSIAPNASVADIRYVLLQGVDRIASLSGKTVTGGRLNVYNTLYMLGGSTQGPVIRSLAATPNPVSAGTTVTLTASGISDSTGTVTALFFYYDTNNNGTHDSSDALLGSTTTMVGGAGSLTVSTTGLAPGTHRYFARVVDNHSAWSPSIATTLSVLPPDDHGDSAATATSIAAPSVTSATLGVIGDVDWFKFDAVAGKSYVFFTQLGTLRDSTLSLYNRNGTGRLVFDDDGGDGFASRIAWTAPASGTYYLAVGSYNNLYAGTYTLNVQVQNAAPVLSPIADRTMPRSQTTLNVPFSASDPDGDTLTYSAQALSVDPLGARACELNETLGLYQWQGSYWTNLRGANEKYMAGSNGGLYFIVPNGTLYQWGGSIAASTAIAQFNTDYYANPSLLHDPPEPVGSPITGGRVTVSISGGVVTITRSAGYTNDFFVRITASDGSASVSDVFKVSVTNAAPQLAPIADQSMHHTQTALSIPISATDSDGDALSYSAQALAVDAMAAQAYELNESLGLYQWQNSYWTNLRGANEKYMAGSNNGLYFIVPNGTLYRWGGSIAASTAIAQFNAAYYANPALIHEASAPSGSPITNGDVTVSVSNGTLNIVRSIGYNSDFYVRVSVNDGMASDAKTFKVSVTNQAPQLAAIGDRSMSHSQTALAIPLSITNADGDALTCSAQVLSIDPLAARAYELNESLGLYQWQNSYWTNLRGANEKYMAGSNGGLYFIVPNGTLYRWGGSIAASTAIAQFNAAYYANPALIHEAASPTGALITSGVFASISDGSLNISRSVGYNNDFYVRVCISDGLASAVETFKVSVTNAAPQLTPIGDQTMPAEQNTLQITLSASDADGDALTYTGQVVAPDRLAAQAYELNQSLGLYQWQNSYWTNLRGANEKYMAGNNNGLYFIVPNGTLYRWGGSIAASTPIAQFNAAYYANPALIHEAQTPAMLAANNPSVAVSFDGNVLTIRREPGYADDFYVRVNVSDGLASAAETFKVSTASMQMAALMSVGEGFGHACVESSSLATSVANNVAVAWAAVASNSAMNEAFQKLSGNAIVQYETRNDVLAQATAKPFLLDKTERLLDAVESAVEHLIDSTSSRRTQELTWNRSGSTRQVVEVLTDALRDHSADNFLAYPRIEIDAVDRIFDQIGSLN